MDQSRSEEPSRGEEPVWLVRAVLVLFLLAAAAFLGQELRRALGALGAA